MDLVEAGIVIRTARKALGLSQHALAKKRKMSRATLSKIETGVIPEIGLRKYLAVCDVLGLELTVAPRAAPPTLAQAFDKKRQEQTIAALHTDQIIETELSG